MAQEAHIHCIPDEILLQVFAHLADIGPMIGEPDPWYMTSIPFITNDSLLAPHPGLRSYPFLGQVCRRWRQLLNRHESQVHLWPELVVDFGHELVTSIHMPLEWSSRRPSDTEFQAMFAGTRLNASKLVEFVRQRRHALHSLTLLNSEGYYTEESTYVQIGDKHDFTTGHLGLLLGLLQDSLQKLHIQHCNDLFGGDAGHWSLLALLPNLRDLHIGETRAKASSNALAQLSCLQKLERLHISNDGHTSKWAVGMEAIPPEWRTLTRLTCLELRFHSMLDRLPQWLMELPALHTLDVSFCCCMNLDAITLLTQLRVLALQGLDLGSPPAADTPVASRMLAYLPDLTPLAKSLTALNLAENAFTRVPLKQLKGLTALQVLDLSNNAELQVHRALTPLLRLPALAIVDVRGVHHRKGCTCWEDDKVATMGHINRLSTALKRRPYPTKVLIDTD